MNSTPNLQPFQLTWLLILLFLISCSFPTQYIKKGIYTSDGYEDSEIEDNLYELKVSGNISTERQRLIDLFYYRAANLAKEDGSDYFLTGAEKFELDPDNFEETKLKHRNYTTTTVQIGFTKVTIKGFVRTFNIEQAKAARRAKKPVKKTQTELRKGVRFISELNQFIAVQKAKEEKEKAKKEAKEAEKEKDTPAEVNQEELDAIDKELDLTEETSLSVTNN